MTGSSAPADPAWSQLRQLITFMQHLGEHSACMRHRIEHNTCMRRLAERITCMRNLSKQRNAETSPCLIAVWGSIIAHRKDA